MGYHILLKGKDNPPCRQADLVFWGVLTGKAKDQKGNIIPPGTVLKAAQAAAWYWVSYMQRALGLWDWSDVMGISGRKGQQDALDMTLY